MLLLWQLVTKASKSKLFIKFNEIDRHFHFQHTSGRILKPNASTRMLERPRKFHGPILALYKISIKRWNLLRPIFNSVNQRHLSLISVEIFLYKDDEQCTLFKIKFEVSRQVKVEHDTSYKTLHKFFLQLCIRSR